MKISRLVTPGVLPSTLAVILAAISTSRTVAQAAQFFCSSGNVTCLIATINKAYRLRGEHMIYLELRTHTLQMVVNVIDGPNGLPSITSNIKIQASDAGSPTVRGEV